MPEKLRCGRRSARPRKLRLSLPNFDLPQEKICQLVISERTGKPVYKKTLAEAFRAELDRGMAVTYYNVAKLLYDQAVGGK
jgi:hypothetical protein